MPSVLQRMLAAGGAAAIAWCALLPAFVGTAQADASSTPLARPAPAPPRQAACGGVWVVVDFGSLGGGTRTACASSHGTGLDALRSAGFAPVFKDSFVYKLSGKPAKPDINKAYWSYWKATRRDDGSYSTWVYSTLGASASQPEQGDAEGWSYLSIGDGNIPPGAEPPTGGAGLTTATASSSPATTEASPAGGGPQPGAAPAEQTSPGSPVGAIVVGATVVAAGAGLGGWWLLNGRKP